MVVLKLGGTSLAEQGQVLEEVAAVARRRPVVIVHGGGKRITEWLERLGVPTRFEDGLRVTDAAAIEVAAAVLRGVVNSELVTALHDVGVNAVGLSGVDGGLLVGERVAGLGLVAHVVGVRRDLIDAILVGGQVPVVAPLARDEDGIVCNVNADDAAAGLAAGLGARQLILMTDVDGIRGADGAKLGSLQHRRGGGADRGRHDQRGDGAQGPGGARRDRRARRRGRHLRRRGAPGARPRARRPGVRHAHLEGAGMTAQSPTRTGRSAQPAAAPSSSWRRRPSEKRRGAARRAPAGFAVTQATSAVTSPSSAS